MTLVLQDLIEAEAAQAIGAGRYERTDERITHRRGFMPLRRSARCRRAS